jgi:hypothetical protein
MRPVKIRAGAPDVDGLVLFMRCGFSGQALLDFDVLTGEYKRRILIYNHNGNWIMAAMQRGATPDATGSNHQETP